MPGRALVGWATDAGVSGVWSRSGGLWVCVLLLAACGGGGGGTPAPVTYTVTASAGTGGSISPQSATVPSGDTATFTITPATGFALATASGCEGTLSGTDYTTGPVLVDCTVNVTFTALTGGAPVSAAQPSLTLVAPKTFRFAWSDVLDATFYRLLENPDTVSGYSQIGSDIGTAVQQQDLLVPLPERTSAQYILQSCNGNGCTDSAAVSPASGLAEAVGYVKASNSGLGDSFGKDVALSSDGTTLAVSANWERSNATGINGDESNDLAGSSGAVYIFVFDGTDWTQQAYIKADNTGPNDFFGSSLSLSNDGNTLAVAAPEERSNATGINGDGSDNSLAGAGAVYVFARSASTWQQQAYLKASNTAASDFFGTSVSLSGDGNKLAVGAKGEDSNAVGVNGTQSNNSAANAGAVYVFARSGTSWTQHAYLKASNTGAGDQFGWSVAFSGDGNYLAIGAVGEGSNAPGINGNQLDDSAGGSGAVYLYFDNAGSWQLQTYVKASNPDADDAFGSSLSLDSDGDTLAVGAPFEDSGASGINGDDSDNTLNSAGAVYLFSRATNWSQQAYLKASNPGNVDQLGWDVSLSSDGNRLLVGAFAEDSNAVGLEGLQSDNSALAAGAAYSFSRVVGSWSQLAYLKASNTEADDQFGRSVHLSGDGLTSVIGAPGEDSQATGINGDQLDNTLSGAGAAYLY